jgi:hypothetical protein
MGFFKAIGNGLNKARDWLFPDEQKIRKVKSDNYTEVPAEEEGEEKNETTERYDAWEEIDNFRMNFFFGSWATKKFKGGIIGEDKVKKELEELEKKRAEKEKQPYQNSLEQEPEKSRVEKEERSSRSSLERELERTEQKRQEKKRRQEEKRSK